MKKQPVKRKVISICGAPTGLLGWWRNDDGSLSSNPILVLGLTEEQEVVHFDLCGYWDIAEGDENFIGSSLDGKPPE